MSTQATGFEASNQSGGPDDSKKWRVQVFRHSSQGLVRMHVENKSGEVLPVTARVHKGYITISEVKLRLDFSDKGDGNSDSPALLVVCRRRDAVAIGTEGRMRKLILKFQSEKECKEFSDYFIKLNPPPALMSRQGLSDREDESGECANYVKRLLNEPDFISYVDHLEGYLLSSEDGRQMLDAFL